jgi:hypothetical protein
MTANSEILPWSLFELSSSDEGALDALAQGSVLLPLGATETEALKQGIREGRRVALSLKTATEGRYHGLCVFGLEQPSPVKDKALSLHAFSLISIPEQVGRPDLRRREHVAEDLLGEVIRFCRTHGFTRVHSYVKDDQESLATMNRLGFRVEGVVHDSPVRAYSVSLRVAASYTGDPYDGKHILNWIADHLHVRIDDTTDTSLHGNLALKTLNPDLGDTRIGGYALPLTFELGAAEDGGTGKVALRAVIGDAGDAKNSVSLVTEDLRELTQDPRLDLTFWPPPSEGASIAVEIREDLFDRFRIDRSNAYFDSGSYGTLLERAIASGNVPQIFFIDFETSQGNPRLIGVARVESVDRLDPNSLWKKYGQISSWADRTAFVRYRAIKRKMTGIIFRELRRVDLVGVGLPVIGHSWTYVPSAQAYEVARRV